MNKSIINYRNSYFIAIIFFTIFGVLFVSASIIVTILLKNILFFIIGCFGGFIGILFALIIFCKTIFKVTFYENKVVFSRFNKVYRVFHRNSFTIKKTMILKNNYALIFQDEFSSKDKKTYGIDYSQKNKKIIEYIYSLKDLDWNYKNVCRLNNL